jgi:hypothetical protein
MKKLLLVAVAFMIHISGIWAQKTEYKIVTSIESIVPMGIGRSRIIENDEPRDYTAFTSTRTSEGKEKTKMKRSDARIDNMRESTLLNFYSAVGINFSNVASNDAILTSMLNAYAQDGWELAFVTSGVESDAGSNDGNGIFVTRYVFKKTVN